VRSLTAPRDVRESRRFVFTPWLSLNVLTMQRRRFGNNPARASEDLQRCGKTRSSRSAKDETFSIPTRRDGKFPLALQGYPRPAA
jgi:hypothetical protein